MIRRSIYRKLTVFILLPVLIIYGIVATVQTRWGIRTALDNAHHALRESTELHAMQCDVVFARTAEVAEGIARYAAVRKAGTAEKEELVQYIRDSLNRRPGIVGSTIAFAPGFLPDRPKGFAPYLYRDPEGRLQYKDLAEEYDFREWDWYAKPSISGKPSWSEPYYDEFGGDVLMCTHSVPFFRDGKFAGVATVDISLDEIRDILDRLSDEKEQYYLFSASGAVISSPKKELVLKETLRTIAQRHQNVIVQKIADDVLAGKPGLLYGTSVVTGNRSWNAYTPLKETGWSLLASIPESEVTDPVYRRLYSIIGTFGTGLVLLVGIIFFVARRIVAPLKRLSVFAGELAAGNLDAKIDGVTGEDEIGQLGRTFDKMVVDLKDNVERRIHEESARKTVESELQVARRIQSSLLPNIFPAFPERKEFDLYALNEPATFMAGDFYDFFFIDKDLLVLVMADVSGKGVPAAMFMAVSRTAIRNFSLSGISPAETMNKLNATLAQDNADCMFVTLFYAHYDLKTGALTYVNGGHNPPYLLRRDGTIEELTLTGPLVAAWNDAVYQEETVFLAKDDLIVMFTDGITEAYKSSNEKPKLFGEERLVELLKRIRGHAAGDLCREIVEETLRFSEGDRQDDITVLAFRQQDDTEPPRSLSGGRGVE